MLLTLNNIYKYEKSPNDCRGATIRALAISKYIIIGEKKVCFISARGSSTLMLLAQISKSIQLKKEKIIHHH